MKKRTMLLLWLGAAISISEIFTGGLLSPLGLVKGFAVIIAGHLIGTGLLALGGYVSFSRKTNAMESVAWSFGSGGGRIIALCNVVQLTGWTIIMIVQGVSAIHGVFPAAPFMAVSLVLSLLVLFWAFLLDSPATRLNDIVVALLALLCVVWFAEALMIKNGAAAGGEGGGISTALAIELSIAMPVSWLPLVGDYSRNAGDKVCASVMPFAGYFTGSVLMYFLGLFIGVAGGGGIFTFISNSPFGIVVCAVVVLSTMTTAFLDLYSAAVSSRQLLRTKSEHTPVLVIGVFAVLASTFFPVDRYETFLTAFLTAIGMVFVPVYTVVFLDFLTRKNNAAVKFQWLNLVLAIIGMAGYRVFSSYDPGFPFWIPTLMSMALIAVLYFLTSLKNNRAKMTRQT